MSTERYPNRDKHGLRQDLHMGIPTTSRKINNTEQKKDIDLPMKGDLKT